MFVYMYVYRRTGRIARTVKSGKFEMFTLLVVVLNCLFIIQDTIHYTSYSMISRRPC